MTALAPEPVVVGAGLGRDAWLDARRKGIGGSDAAAIAGLDKWRSPFEVYLDKIGELPDREMGDAAYWGTVLEPLIADRFAAEHPDLTVLPSPGIVASPDRPWQLANVDRLLAASPDARPHAVLEVKTTNQYKADEWAGEQIPDRTALQLAHYMDVYDLREAWAAVLIGGQEYRAVHVERDDELIGYLRQIESDFWQRVVERRPPPVDGSDSCTDLIGRLYQVAPDAIRVLDPAEVIPALNDRRVAKAAEKTAKADAQLASNRIKALLAECEAGVLDGDVVCTWKQTAAGHRALNVKKEWS